MALLPSTDTVTPFVDHMENSGSLSYANLLKHFTDLGHVSVNVSVKPNP